MKQFTKDHAEWILGIAGTLMGALLIWFLIWGALVVTRNINRTFRSPIETENQLKFDLDKVEQLDFRGLNR